MDGWQTGWDKQLQRDREWARCALQQWADFPVGGQRPLVLVGPAIWSTGGFRDGEAKLAYLSGDWQLPSSVPTVVLRTVRENLRVGVTRLQEGRPLQIHTARRSRAPFETDRGPLNLSAWQLESDQANGPIWVLDPELAPSVWAPTRDASDPAAIHAPHGSTVEATTLGQEGDRLRVSFTGGSPRGVEYPSAEVLESERAVAVLPVAHDLGLPGFRIMQGYARDVVAELGRPLGDRVLVDVDASPLAVLSGPRRDMLGRRRQVRERPPSAPG